MLVVKLGGARSQIDTGVGGCTGNAIDPLFSPLVSHFRKKRLARLNSHDCSKETTAQDASRDRRIPNPFSQRFSKLDAGSTRHGE